MSVPLYTIVHSIFIQEQFILFVFPLSKARHTMRFTTCSIYFHERKCIWYVTVPHVHMIELAIVRCLLTQVQYSFHIASERFIYIHTKNVVIAYL